MPNAPDCSPEATRATPGNVPSAPERAAAGDKTAAAAMAAPGSAIHETGGPKGPNPTRFGDWERAGRCIDF
jgi:hypothetical protein